MAQLEPKLCMINVDNLFCNCQNNISSISIFGIYKSANLHHD